MDFMQAIIKKKIWAMDMEGEITLKEQEIF